WNVFHTGPAMTGSMPKSVVALAPATRVLLMGGMAIWFQRLDAREGLAEVAVAAMTVTTTAMESRLAPSARRLVNRLTIRTSTPPKDTYPVLHGREAIVASRARLAISTTLTVLRLSTKPALHRSAGSQPAAMAAPAARMSSAVTVLPLGQ